MYGNDVLGQILREYFLKGIKILDGIYIAYLLLKYNSDMENEKKKELLFS